jgi:hypothetical protein
MVPGLLMKAIPPTATMQPLATPPLLSTSQLTETTFSKAALQVVSSPPLLLDPISSPMQGKAMQGRASLIKTFSMPRAIW